MLKTQRNLLGIPNHFGRHCQDLSNQCQENLQYIFLRFFAKEIVELALFFLFLVSITNAYLNMACESGGLGGGAWSPHFFTEQNIFKAM